MIRWKNQMPYYIPISADDQMVPMRTRNYWIIAAQIILLAGQNRSLQRKLRGV